MNCFFSRVQGIVIGLLCTAAGAAAQVTGGQFAFEFLRLPQSPHVSALGGINVSNPETDIMMALQNPALMRPALHNDLGLNYNAYYAGISSSNLGYGYYAPKLETSFIFGVQALKYGTFTATDDQGNQYGDVQAGDYAISIGASRQYLERWRYGAAIKWAHSNLYDSKASALLLDVGVVYADTSNLIDVGITAKNMGFMVQKYSKSAGQEPLPFDLQLSFSKRFAHLPLRVMATVHHLYEWDVRYNNPADIDQSNLFGTQDTAASSKSYFADKLFRHFIFAAEVLLGKRITATVAYNHLRRGELALDDKKGAAGFSFGIGVHLNKFDVHYARSYYHIAGAYNEFGLSLSLGKIIGVGKKTEATGWNKAYEDWKL